MDPRLSSSNKQIKAVSLLSETADHRQEKEPDLLAAILGIQLPVDVVSNGNISGCYGTPQLSH
jgi:hypothetical protein